MFFGDFISDVVEAQLSKLDKLSMKKIKGSVSQLPVAVENKEEKVHICRFLL